MVDATFRAELAGYSDDRRAEGGIEKERVEDIISMARVDWLPSSFDIVRGFLCHV